jgi:hypothetical protein
MAITAPASKKILMAIKSEIFVGDFIKLMT